ncbi:ComEA family DNA-binding protein [Streptomyces marincola]|uniref:ComEA family DNA-binding protein n=1 Tax=Streptomyces marincola TaxID=2878388 RepID=UPI001CF0E072|nr:ComEA family DNA-binding protein [Streptomyces marincola]UCM87879.1 ComEA family DNA-binding protein [Streptomyces marincola]
MPLPWRRRARLALGERLPSWCRLRCGLEPRAVAALCVVLLVATGFAVHHWWSGRPRQVAAVEQAAAGTTARPAEPAASSAAPPGAAEGDPAAPPDPPAASSPGVVVDVAGEVREPGVYTLPAGARVSDAIEAAGGAPGDAADGINRARVLVDGEQVLVGGEPQAAPPPTGAPGASTPGAPISLNTATAEQLQDLPGVGPVLAGRIVAYRTERGAFTSVEQLGEVTGIGERRLAELRDRVTP